MTASSTFDEALCLAVHDLLLRNISGGFCRSSLSLAGQLADLVNSHSSLEAWLRDALPLVDADMPAIADPRGWRPLLELFPTLLLKDRRWTSNVPRCADRRLLDMAAVAVRLQALEAQFAITLEQRQRRTLYNFAYGLSHELNNPLANIASRAGLLARQEPSATRRTLLEAIIDSALRGTEMLGDLMLIARSPTIDLQPIVLAAWLEPMLDRARSWSRPQGVAIELEHGDLQDSARATGEEISVRADRTALTEAVWALLRNGIEAMSNGGTMKISVQPCRSWVQLRIDDQGSGLSEHALENAFDPYYSGREAGRGLGVGLTKALRIIELHNGLLELRNRPEGGCSAVVSLPRAVDNAMPSNT